MSALAAVVLAGGKSARMGTSKALIELDGEPLLARAIRLISPAVSRVIVVAAEGQALPAIGAVTIVRDTSAGRGPLQGLADGLTALAEAEAAFVCATDMPFLHAAFVARLDALHRTTGASIVVARKEGRAHPLAAIYSKRVLPTIQALLARDVLRLTTLLAEVSDTLFVDEAQLLADPSLRAIDPDLKALVNVNTLAELANLSQI
jgi:molybdopterin-guanine dinucleotide biosynthesis protein A